MTQSTGAVTPEIKLTKKQIKIIARLWSACILMGNDITAFTDEISNADRVVTESHEIAIRLLGKHSYMTNLEEIINYVINLKP